MEQPNLNNILALDRVEIGAGRCGAKFTIFAACIPLVLAAPIAFGGYMAYKTSSGAIRPIAVSFLSVVVLAFIIWAAHTMLQFHHWRIDSDGIYAGGLFGRSRFISWEEIRDVVIDMGSAAAVPSISLTQPIEQNSGQLQREGIDGTTQALVDQWKNIQECARDQVKGLKVMTADGSFSICNDLMLWASILQHMNLVRSNYGNPLLRSTLAYWAPVPSDTPQEMEWSNMRPRSAVPYTIGMFVAGGLFIAILAGQFYGHPKCLIVMPTVPIVCLALCLRTIIGGMKHITRHVTLTHGNLKIDTPLGIYTERLDSLNAGYDISGNLALSRGDSSRLGLVPLDKRDPESRRLHYAIIKHLREHGQAIALPEALRIEEESEIA